MPITILVRYGELALKSEPVRRRFEHSLIASMKRSLSGLKFEVRTERGRMFVETGAAAAAIKRLAKVPGITSLSPSMAVKAELNIIRARAVQVARKALRPGMSFAVRTNRAGAHPFTSRDVNVDLGSTILAAVKGARVDLTKPDVEISVDVRGEGAYIFTSSVAGVGGLPVGTQGKVVSVFSGSANDAAAAFMMIKRGCTVFPLFPNPGALTSRAAKRVIASAKKLASFDSAPVLWVFPFRRTLAAIAKSPEETRFYLLRRAALRAAGHVAKRVGAEAIVIGDDARMISAQGLSNLNAIDTASVTAVLRPLAGTDETGVKAITNKIGLRPSAEALLLPGNPSAVSAEGLQNLERDINIERTIDDDSKRARTISLVRL